VRQSCCRSLLTRCERLQVLGTRLIPQVVLVLLASPTASAHRHMQKRTSADLRDRAPCSIQITRFGVTADGYPGDQTAGYIGGYVRRTGQRR